jgi:gamma-glutamyl-gamma-aminobutyrate hydrolase PuuD
MQSLEINSNSRLDPILGNTSEFDFGIAKRVVDIALPFICMNAQCSQIVSVALGVTHVYKELSGDDGPVELKTLFQLGLIVSSTALAIFFPVAQAVFSNTVQLGVDTHHLFSGLYHFQVVESLRALFNIANTFIYFGSMVYPSPFMLALSLLMQATKELFSGIEIYWNERKLPEFIAKTILACMRCYAAEKHINTVYRNYFGKQLTQKDLLIIGNERYIDHFKDSNSNLDLNKMLEKKGFSSFLKGLDFSENELVNLSLRDIVFENCKFRETLFENSLFQRVTAYGCQFDNARWVESIIHQCFFDHCSFNGGAFVSSLFSQSFMISPDCSRLAWDHSVISESLFFRPNLNQATFLGSDAQNSWIACARDLSDTLFCGNENKFNFIGQRKAIKTKPVVALPWDFREEGRFAPYIKEALFDNDVTVLRFEMKSKAISSDELDREVKHYLGSIDPSSQQPGSSIPERLLRDAKKGSQIARIQEMVAQVLGYCDGVALPGGFADVEPEIYGGIRESRTDVEKSYKRIIVEIAAIKQAIDRQIPVMGTCRGSQMINVYLGGTLHQHVPRRSDLQFLQLTDSPKSQEIGIKIGRVFMSLAMHHQAANQLGKGVHVLYTCDGVVKMFTTDDQLMLGVQVHPENYIMIRAEIDRIREMHGDLCAELHQMIIDQNHMVYKIFLDRIEHFKRKRLAAGALVLE